MRNITIIAIVLGFGLFGCSKSDRLNFTDESAPAPAQVSGVRSVANPGGAVLTYKIPADPNLSYVKAVYEIRPGVTSEAKSSTYTDTLALVGFGDTNPHQVKIYSVGKNEKMSEPVIISVTPLTPPVKSIYATADMIEAFGGVSVSFANASKANISVQLLIDSTGKGIWSPLYTYYTGNATGKFSVRGMSSKEKKFGLVIRDRYSNLSDTLIKNLTPRFEIAIAKNTWSILRLPTDQFNAAAATYPIEKIYDGKWAILGGDCFASPNASVLPQWFTLDLGKKVLLSRFKEHQAPTSHLYVASAVKRFELWGSNSPSADGSFDSWVLLGTFDSYKPSGSPLGTTTAEDKNYGNFLGEDFGFDNQPAAYRYYRFKTLETYSSTGQIVIGELSFFGEIQ